MIGLNSYQKEALETATHPRSQSVIYPALGLAGEAGEVADKVKKVLRDNNGTFDFERREAIAYELGDVLWNVAVLAREIGYSLQQVAEMNIAKLQSRQQCGTIGGSGDNR